MVWHVSCVELYLTDRLPGEGVDQLGDFIRANLVLPEDPLANTDTVLASGRPVELLHTSVTDKRGIQGGEIVTSHNDGDTGNLVLVVPGPPRFGVEPSASLCVLYNDCSLQLQFVTL